MDILDEFGRKAKRGAYIGTIAGSIVGIGNKNLGDTLQKQALQGAARGNFTGIFVATGICATKKLHEYGEEKLKDPQTRSEFNNFNKCNHITLPNDFS